MRNIRSVSARNTGRGRCFCRNGVPLPAFWRFLSAVRFADSKNASTAGNRESKAFRRKYRRRLLLPAPARQCRRAPQTFHVKPRCLAIALQKNPFRTATSRTCANKPATQTGLRKNRRNASLFIKLSGSYKTFRKSFACLFHVKRFQTTGRSGQDALFGRGAAVCNAQTTPAFHVKRFVEPRQLADTRESRTLPLFRRASPPRLRPNAPAVNCFT